jgi:transcriptional regulator with XRE-family HTH domain
VGVHRTYVGGIERGERNVSLVNIGRIAAGLGISLGDLMAEVDRMLTRTS